MSNRSRCGLPSQSIVRFVLVGVILGTASTHGLADVADAVNRLREEGCPDGTGAAGPLNVRPALVEVARRLAGGDELAAALTADSDYRARSSTSIYIRTTEGDVAEVLVEGFCGTVSDPGLKDIGVFRRGDETWIVLATPLVLPDRLDADEVAERVVELINEARLQPRRCGRERFPAAALLTASAPLQRAALAHARDMALSSFLDHRGSDGSSPSDRVSRAGYEWQAVAENVAAGSTTAEDVVAGWLASPGHCANLMNSRYSATGVAVVVEQESEKGAYWVQVFAAPCVDACD